MAQIRVYDISVIGAFEGTDAWDNLMDLLDKIGGQWIPQGNGVYLSPEVTRYDLFSLTTAMLLLDTAAGMGFTVGEQIDIIDHPAFIGMTDLQKSSVSVPSYVPVHPNKGVNDTWEDYGAEWQSRAAFEGLAPCNILEGSDGKNYWPVSVLRGLRDELQPYVIKSMSEWPEPDDE